MRSGILTVAFAALGTASPISLSEMLDNMSKMEDLPANSTTSTTNGTTTAAPNEERDFAARDSIEETETKPADTVCDGLADFLGVGAEINGTKTTSGEARENMNKGYSWDGPVYDGEKGFIPNGVLFDDDPDKPDGPSSNPPGGAQYPH